MFTRGKEKKSKQLPDTVEAASTGSAGYPKDYHVSALRERRLLFAIRGITITLMLSIVLNVVMGFLFVGLFPLKEIRPFLVQVEDAGTVVASIKPIQNTFQAKDLLTEKLVREYVINRHEILRSNAIMQSRWAPDGYIGLTSSPQEYARFRAQVAPVLKEIRSQDAQRRAEILSVSAVTAGKVYIVDFKSTSYDQNDQIIDQKVYTATIEIAFKPLKNLTKSEMLINPTGFTVTHYTLAEKG